jgi:hypothetical protein
MPSHKRLSKHKKRHTWLTFSKRYIVLFIIVGLSIAVLNQKQHLSPVYYAQYAEPTYGSLGPFSATVDPTITSTGLGYSLLDEKANNKKKTIKSLKKKLKKLKKKLKQAKKNGNKKKVKQLKKKIKKINKKLLKNKLKKLKKKLKKAKKNGNKKKVKQLKKKIKKIKKKLKKQKK